MINSFFIVYSFLYDNDDTGNSWNCYLFSFLADNMDQHSFFLWLKRSHSKDKIDSFFFMLIFSQGLGYVPLVTWATKGFVLPFSINDNHIFVQKVTLTTYCFDHLAMNTSQPRLCFTVVMTNLLGSASVTLSICLTNTPFGNSLSLSYKILIILISTADFLKPISTKTTYVQE